MRQTIKLRIPLMGGVLYADIQHKSKYSQLFIFGTVLCLYFCLFVPTSLFNEEHKNDLEKMMFHPFFSNSI